MNLINGLPEYLALGGEDKKRLIDNGGMTVGQLREDRNFSEAFNKALVTRYNAHEELVEALQNMVSHAPYWFSKMDVKQIDKDALAMARAALQKAGVPA